MDRLGDCEYRCIAVDDGLRFERCERCGKRRVVAVDVPTDEQGELVRRWMNGDPMFVICKVVDSVPHPEER